MTWPNWLLSRSARAWIVVADWVPDIAALADGMQPAEGVGH
jgi:hypothetical protein